MDAKLFFRCAPVALAIGLLLTAPALSAVMLGPTSIVGSDMGESHPTAGAFVNMINQTGLDKPYTSGVTDFDTYFDTGDEPFAQATGGNNWQSQTFFTLPVTGFVDFDFGAVASIDRLAVWNISMKDIKIHVSDTTVAEFEEVASFTLPNHINFPFSYPHDLLDLGGTHAARFMRIEIDSVHLFSPTYTFGFAIVGEVVASAVVETGELDGDYNDDGTVDAADYSTWRKFDGTDTDLPNDTTAGSVDPEDYDVWREGFGSASAGSGGQVPEPGSAVVGLFCILAFERWRAKRTVPCRSIRGFSSMAAGSRALLHFAESGQHFRYLLVNRPGLIDDQEPWPN